MQPRKYNPEKHHRRSIRLKGYDYSQEGAYFITICTYNRKCHLGDVQNGIVRLSRIGEIARQFWLEIPDHFDNTELDEFIFMPNHLHGILDIVSVGNESVGIQSVGVQHVEPLRRIHRYQKIIPQSIGSIIRSYKASVTRWCRQNGHEYFRWQRNYFEHVIRNEKSLYQIRQYIINNPLQWQFDNENPINWKKKS